ncbi:MAG: FeoA family protein [Steroidobacterales bacterium]
MNAGPETLSLLDLPIGQRARVVDIDASSSDIDAGERRRLAAIGFLPGEFVSVLAHSPLGRNPIAVAIGNNMFGLRRIEAACIRVHAEPA